MFWLILLLAECALLSYIDRRLWKTYFTPLHFLMIPYLLILLLTLCVAGRFGLEKFYYPSLLPWIIGLPLFAAGGYGVFFLTRKIKAKGGERSFDSGSSAYPISFWITLAGLCVFGINFFHQLAASDPSCGLGSDCFAGKLVGNRFFSHLGVFLSSLITVNLFLFHRPTRCMPAREKTYNRWLLLLLLLSVAAVVFLQIKSWVILPLVAGVIARLAAKKSRFNIKAVSVVAMAGIFLFFASYLLMYLYGNGEFKKGTPFVDQLSSVGVLCVHYLTSGTMGLSIDMQQGVLESYDLRYVLTPFVNVWNLLTGQPMVSGYNPEFLYTGLNYTNVRSLFGTWYVFCPPFLFGLFVFLFGTAGYGIKRLTEITQNQAVLFVYAWLCSLLFMGWFDSYLQLLSSWEIPLWILAISMLNTVKRTQR